jgi:hypothetical protein
MRSQLARPALQCALEPSATVHPEDAFRGFFFGVSELDATGPASNSGSEEVGIASDI